MIKIAPLWEMRDPNILNLLRAILMVNSSSNPNRTQYFQHTVSISIKIKHILDHTT
jgi:hypothetical protein